MLSIELNNRYFEQIQTNRYFFETLLTQMETENDSISQMEHAKTAIAFALTASTGYFSSSRIEQVFLNVASENEIELPETYTEGTVLHIMTQAYADGGHTRVVERWVESGHDDQSHSLALTSAARQVLPERLEKGVAASGGTVFRLDDELSDLQKGLQLRRIASEFQYVVLHVHMYDIIPLIAFGTNTFKRPVIFFNHADHKFWVGISIADVIFHFRSFGCELALSRRGASKNIIIGLPFENKGMAHISKKQARESLNIPEDADVIVTVGTEYKYKPFLEYNFIKVVENLLYTHKNLYIVAVGPGEKKRSKWKTSVNKFAGRLQAVGSVPHNDLFKYLHSADLVLDSFPISGGVALLDAIACSKSVLSLETPVGQLDYIYNSQAHCASLDELFQKIDTYLGSQTEKYHNLQSVLGSLQKYPGGEKWQKNLVAKYASVPERHSVTAFTELISMSSLDAYLENEYERGKNQLFNPKLFSVEKRRAVFGRRFIKYTIAGRSAWRLSRIKRSLR